MTECFHCNGDHLSRECPRHTRGRKITRRRMGSAHGGTVDKDEDNYSPVICLTCGLPGHERKDCTHVPLADPWTLPEVQDIHQRLRMRDPDEPLIESAFRRQMGMPLVTHSWAMAEALRQLDELHKPADEGQDTEHV